MTSTTLIFIWDHLVSQNYFSSFDFNFLKFNFVSHFDLDFWKKNWTVGAVYNLSRPYSFSVGAAYNVSRPYSALRYISVVAVATRWVLGEISCGRRQAAQFLGG